jgi:[acyl-carrier-protein] S-malonyltransferase
MASAARPFADALARLDPADPSLRVVANADGAVLPDGRRLLSRLLVQLTAPVRFDLCLQTLGAAPVRVVVELAPAGTLTALVQRTLPDVSRVALRTPADLALARDLLAAEAS